MKKNLILFFLLFFTIFSLFCQEAIPGRRIFIDGTAPRSEQMVFFIQNFSMEMNALGYNIVGNKDDADYIFKFNVIENMIMYADGVSRRAPTGEPSWFIQISLIVKKTENELISFSFPFTELEEMYEYNQYLFYRVMINIPLENSQNGGGGDNIVVGLYDTRWQNKLLYITITADYKISYFQLKENGLYREAGVYKDGIDPNSDRFKDGQLTEGEYTLYHNNVYALASLTLGVEYQFLNFLSAEAAFGAYLGQSVEKKWHEELIFNLETGIKIKYNFKRPNFMASPYAGFNFPISIKNDFLEFPKISIGGGIQIAFRATTNSAFYVNAGYQHFLGDVIAKNSMAAHGYPQPDKIHFKHFTFSVGGGYKYGFFDRKKK